MKRLDLGRYALNICVAAVMLSGCAGSADNSAMPPVNGAGERLPYHKTFNYTGRKQMFTVPPGVKKLKVIAVGAHGGGYGDNQGFGGRMYAIIPVTPGEKLAVFVGGQGSGTAGGFDGGGNGGSKSGSESGPGYGGGGASDVRENGDRKTDRILVVGGGGGKGGDGYEYLGGDGGNGGGSTGGSGLNGGTSSGSSGGGGGGGTQHGGGSGGGSPIESRGSNGSFGAGGAGGAGCQTSSCVYGGSGGGGGGGYYGGGGGGAGGAEGYFAFAGGGGGGGSSYVEPSAYAYRSWQGWKKIHTPNGLVVISWQ